MNNPDKRDLSSINENRANPPGRILPRWLWIYFAVVLAVILVLHTTELTGDPSIANIITMVLGIVSVLVLLVWFCGFSRFSRRWRWGVLGGSLAAVVLFGVMFKVDRLSGEMVPTFAFRWSHKPDELLKVLPTERAVGADKAVIDSLAATPDDFPQFLGPDRSAAVENVKLARDWAARPPKQLWRHEIGAGWSAFAVVHGHALTLEQRGELELATCYNVTTGRLEWAHSIPARYEHVAAGVGPRSTPTIDRGLVYTVGATGIVQCLDGASGECRWQKNLLEELHITREDDAAAISYGRANSPLVVDDLVIVPGGGPPGGPMVSLVAYDKKTGDTVWHGGERQISYSSPAIATLGGVRQILIVNEANVSGHDVKTGKVLWEYPWEAVSSTRPNVAQAVPVPPDRVFVSKGYGQGAALLKLAPAGDGGLTVDTLWQNNRVMRTKFTNVTTKDGYVYGLSDGVLECVELASGRRMWRNGRYRQGQLLRAGDLLLVMAESGEVFLVEASPEQENHVLGHFQAIEGMSWNNLALVGPYLLVRNSLEAACYELPMEEKP
jgi:outer membrane protein assembly factor BamB